MPVTTSIPPSDQAFQASPAMTPLLSEGMNVWVFSLGGKTVKVEASSDLSTDLWKKLEAYIQVLKPLEEGNSA